jgi:hypothetical protein
MTPDERAALDSYAEQYGMDSADVDAALSCLSDPTPAMARAAITAYALRRDLVAGRESRAIIPAARRVVAAWRAPAESADEHMRRLAEALANLEQALLMASYEVEIPVEIPEE